MKRTNTRSGSRSRYYARYIAHYTKKNHVVMLLGILFIAGAVLGTMLVRTASGDMIDLLLRLMGDFSMKRRGQSLYDNFFSAFVTFAQLLGAVFLTGFCAIGQPAQVGVPFLRGLGFGFSAGILYYYYGSAAAGFVALFMLPGMLLSTVALLFCCNEGLRLSGSLWRALQGREDQMYSLRIYCARFIAAALICAAAALLEALVYALFGNSFVLG